MKITVAGTGYVGLVNGVCLAEMGHEVVCIDRDETKVNALQKGIPTIYEPGLEGLLKKNTRSTFPVGTNAKIGEIIPRLKPPPVHA
ncbi:hypothetical protein WQ57_01300 [Mesobacillus campisalis]|uniref:UDP-glucose/GDP-mannose dehydrogenase N-terminal domain-containing protein n=1 Tax=Mesobacillus campisalis TaxID=1408103 RepID=A0A0M2T3V3_9BACI|nr:hypothetical protein WQ57_01300 [Mesobacillus campisalis]